MTKANLIVCSISLIFLFFTACNKEDIKITPLEASKELVTKKFQGQDIIFEKSGDYFLLDDMMFTEEQLAKSNETDDKGFLAHDWTRKWHNRTIVFKVDPSMPNSWRVYSAINKWKQQTWWKFKWRTNETDYLYFKNEGPNGTCASIVGRSGGKQDLRVGHDCNVADIMHEIGHAVGLEHEHQRPDRDHFIKIQWHNIQNKNKQWFYKIYTNHKKPNSYSENSIMHYFPTAFSKNGNHTIVRKNGSPISTDADNTVMPWQDRFTVNQLYYQ